MEPIKEIEYKRITLTGLDVKLPAMVYVLWLTDMEGVEMEPIVIKKYKNRKIYHTETCEYITLSELLVIVRVSERPVQVIDHSTGTDITLDTLKGLLPHLKLSHEELVKLIKGES